MGRTLKGGSRECIPDGGNSIDKGLEKEQRMGLENQGLQMPAPGHIVVVTEGKQRVSCAQREARE